MIKHMVGKADKTLDGSGIAYRSLCGMMTRRRPERFVRDWSGVTCIKCLEYYMDPDPDIARAEILEHLEGRRSVE